MKHRKWVCPICGWNNWTLVEFPLRDGSYVKCRNATCWAADGIWSIQVKFSKLVG